MPKRLTCAEQAKHLCVLCKNVNNLDFFAAGVRFTLNHSGLRKGTVGIRISHIEDYANAVEKIKKAVEFVGGENMLDQVLVNKSYTSSPISNRKTLNENRRTVYVILRPKNGVYKHLKDTIPRKDNAYGPMDQLFDALDSFK